MSELKIVTNNVPRDILQTWQLSKKELAEFDYLIHAPDNATEQQLEELWLESGASFFRYKGRLYDMGEFSRIIPQGSKRYHPMECNNPAFAGWHGYLSDSFFSGLVIRYANDNESVIVGLYLS